jgi:hypothetical protein
MSLSLKLHPPCNFLLSLTRSKDTTIYSTSLCCAPLHCHSMHLAQHLRYHSLSTLGFDNVINMIITRVYMCRCLRAYSRHFDFVLTYSSFPEHFNVPPILHNLTFGFVAVVLFALCAVVPSTGSCLCCHTSSILDGRLSQLESTLYQHLILSLCHVAAFVVVTDSEQYTFVGLFTFGHSTSVTLN